MVGIGLESPNASKIETDFREFALNFTISGPGNVKRSFLQGLGGAEKYFIDKIARSNNAVIKQVFTKLVSAKKNIDREIVAPLSKKPITMTESNVSLFIDPALRGVKVSGSSELEETTSQGDPHIPWPYTNRVRKFFVKHKFLLKEKMPHYRSFDCISGRRREHKFSIEGSAYRNMPIELYLAIFAILLSILMFLLVREV
jgi:hypothetical protein